MVLTKEIELPEDLMDLAIKEFDCPWQTNKVKIKRFKFGDQADLEKESTTVKMIQVGREQKVSADIDPAELQIKTILKGVVSAPWMANDLAAVRDLPGPIAQWVLGQLSEFNTIEFKKKEI